MTTVDALLALLAVIETAWFVVYVTGPWRDTSLGWVWLLKGGLLACLWCLMLVNRHLFDVPDRAWIALGGGLVVAHAAWLYATVRARFFTD